MIISSIPKILPLTQTTFISCLLVLGVALSRKGSSGKDENPSGTIKRQKVFIASLKDQVSSLVVGNDQLERVGRLNDAELEELRVENRSLRQQIKDYSFRVSQLEAKLKEQ